ncbi:hypothetical protein TELCIR_10203 [Teladorsagia circumcincta]|uniref:PiggyBac transposable element-derived protein domain-containing protein n=1 Tax=Teladorsagia circumcincta TaxID=45464 RepID=A0A2G9UCQ9_TELCI|nr:hypothetical protein TELCIR_10203 [Teladorsagia circumcincta]
MTSPRAWNESCFQSIDESMVKFKRRSSMKQNMLLKLVKRVIKLWQRRDAKTEYVYDLNIYAGKETSNIDGTVGERVVKTLLSLTMGCRL